MNALEKIPADAVWQVFGHYYKIGARKYLFRWNGTAWIRSNADTLDVCLPNNKISRLTSKKHPTKGKRRVVRAITGRI